jgi:hypothetical protein
MISLGFKTVRLCILCACFRVFPRFDFVSATVLRIGRLRCHNGLVDPLLWFGWLDFFLILATTGTWRNLLAESLSVDLVGDKRDDVEDFLDTLSRRPRSLSLLAQ